MRVLLVAVGLVALSGAAQTRPAILGVSHMAVYTSDAVKTEHFYVHDIGLKKGEDPESSVGVRYYVNEEQFIEVLALPDHPVTPTTGASGAPAANSGVNRLDHLAYITVNADEMRKYLGVHGVTVPDAVKHGSDGSAWFDVKDPEDNKVEFVEPPARLLGMKSVATLYTVTGADPIGRRIIHVGMLVRSRRKKIRFIGSCWDSSRIGTAGCIPTIRTGCRSRFRMGTTGWSIWFTTARAGRITFRSSSWAS
jgi:catechol 2,3-dioxygenase-like lactoylglutathione lyase family enzyme